LYVETPGWHDVIASLSEKLVDLQTNTSTRFQQSHSEFVVSLYARGYSQAQHVALDLTRIYRDDIAALATLMTSATKADVDTINDRFARLNGFHREEFFMSTISALPLDVNDAAVVTMTKRMINDRADQHDFIVTMLTASEILVYTHHEKHMHIAQLVPVFNCAYNTLVCDDTTWTPTCLFNNVCSPGVDNDTASFAATAWVAPLRVALARSAWQRVLHLVHDATKVAAQTGGVDFDTNYSVFMAHMTAAHVDEIHSGFRFDSVHNKPALVELAKTVDVICEAVSQFADMDSSITPTTLSHEYEMLTKLKTTQKTKKKYDSIS
jgi:hypothetical protein